MLKMHGTWTGTKYVYSTVGGGCVILGMPASMQPGQGQSKSKTRMARSRDQLVVALRVLRRCERRALREGRSLLARHLADRGDARLG